MYQRGDGKGDGAPTSHIHGPTSHGVLETSATANHARLTVIYSRAKQLSLHVVRWFKVARSRDLTSGHNH